MYGFPCWYIISFDSLSIILVFDNGISNLFNSPLFGIDVGGKLNRSLFILFLFSLIEIASIACSPNFEYNNHCFAAVQNTITSRFKSLSTKSLCNNVSLIS